jgi:gliding motility-associated-like protein
MALLKGAKELLYATFFGEDGGLEHVDGGTSRFDKRGIVYQAVCGSCGGRNNFPTTPGAWSNDNNSKNCNNAAFKFDLSSLIARFDTNTPEFDMPGIRSGCYPLDLVFLNKSIGGEAFFWDFGNGFTTDQPDSVEVIYENPGVYEVVLTATDINTCIRESKARGTITVFDYNFDIMDPDSICFGDVIRLRADGGTDYKWKPGESLSNPYVAEPVATPDTTTVYTVNITDHNGCKFEDSVEITVVPEIISDFNVLRRYDCLSPVTFQFKNLSRRAEDYLWDFGDGNTSVDYEPMYRYTDSDSIRTYRVTLTASASFCSEDRIEDITSVKPFIPNFVTPNGDNKNDRFVVRTDHRVELKVFNRLGKEVYSNDLYQNEWPPEGHSTGVYFYEITFSDQKTTCKGWVEIRR